MSNLSVGYGVTPKPTLAYILWSLWDEKCAWGDHVIKLRETEIDHIVPKSMSASPTDPNRMKLERWNLPIDMDVHHPMNLAPICRQHNADKGESYYWALPEAIAISKKAVQKQHKVIHQAAVSTKAHVVGSALAKAWSAAEGLPGNHDVIETLGPGLLQKLLQLGVDYTLISQLFIDSPYSWEPLEVTVRANDETRLTETICTRVCGLEWKQLLQTVALAVQKEVITSLEQEARSRASNEYSKSLDPGHFNLQHDSYVVKLAEFTSNFDGTFDFAFEGFTLGGAVSIGLWESGDGSTTDEQQIEGDYRQSFSAYLSCDLAEVEMLTLQQAIIGRNPRDTMNVDFE